MRVARLQPKEFVEQVPNSICYSEAEALEYTRWLATHHYENFHVASLLLPRALHQDFYNVYAFCRWADDLGDEIPDGNRAVKLEIHARACVYLPGGAASYRRCIAEKPAILFSSR